jgi:hypothetical protein
LPPGYGERQTETNKEDSRWYGEVGAAGPLRCDELDEELTGCDELDEKPTSTAGLFL